MTRADSYENALVELLRQFYRDIEGAREVQFSDSGLEIAMKYASQIGTLLGPNDELNLLLSEANQDKEAMSSRIFNLECALQRVVAASDQFVRDTGLKHGDLITDAVEWARQTLPTATGEQG